ncbi:hypothetical protein J6590_071365 [Homalodisca vitripennis]|nr:hypothetical protein J6590_071365 [Homalodisca vitripennis]
MPVSEYLRFFMSFKSLSQNFPASPLVLPAGKNFCKTFNTRIEACPDPLSTIAGVDVIGTSKHKKETQKLELHFIIPLFLQFAS